MLGGRALPLRTGLISILFFAAASFPGQEPVSATMVQAAQELLAALRPELRARCLQSLDSENRLEWSYLPGRRVGVSLKEMSAAERQAARALLATALSSRGYQKATGVLELEGILKELETFGGLRRDPELYWLAIFGSPAQEKPWTWRFEGHHLSLNFSAAGGRVVATTPAFFGANPARVPKGSRAGWRLLAAEEDLARQLASSLDERQRRIGIVSTTAPADIILSPDRKKVPEAAGIPHSEMTEKQRDLLLALVGEYLGNMRPEVGQAQWRKVRASGLEKIRFAWAGGLHPGQGHYYRVQGPTFVIEYDNTQDGANHIHSVWRDLENDFGGDLLRRHYAQSPHHRETRPRNSKTSDGG